MKTSKLFITSLLAAAAMSASAYADTVTYTGGDDVTNKTLGGYTLTDTITMGTTIADDSSAANLGSMQAGGNFYPPAYTLSFWVDISALPSSNYLTLFTYGGTSPAGNDGSNALALNSDGTLTFGQGKTNGTSFEFGTGTNRQVTTTGNALTTNTVYHIALVNNGKSDDSAPNTATLYINGTAVLNNVTVNLNMGNGTESTVFSNLNLASASNISYGEATLLSNVALSQQGVQKVATHNSYNLIWNGSASNAWNSTDANWTKEGTEGNVAFEDTDNVTFNSNASVTIQNAGVTAGSVAVTAGAVSLSGGTLTAIRGVSVTGGTLTMNLGIGGGTDVSVTNDGVLSGTITSMGAGSSLTLAGTGASAVTLNGAIGANAVVSVSGNSALTGTITSMGAGSSLTLAGTGAASEVTISTDPSASIANSATLNITNGSVTWVHDCNNSNQSGNKTTGASIFIGEGSSFTEKTNYKYHATFTGALSGAGTLISLTPTAGDKQSDGWRKITLSGSTANFTGEWQLESANGNNESYPHDNRHVLGILNSSDGVFGGVVNFTSTNADAAKVSSKLVLHKDMEIGGLKGSLANTSVVGASAVSNDTVGTITTADRALTINTAANANYDYAGKIEASIASITKKGTGTQILSGDNSAYAGTVTLEAGTLGVGHANALGAGAVNVTGNAKLALGDTINNWNLGISNNISIADSVKLTLGGGYVVALNGAITESGTLRADMPGHVALGGDNSGFSGGVEVVGTTVDAAHASALGTGILKISSADSGRTFGIVQTSVANVALHDVSIELVGADSAALRTSSSGSFKVASGATLYLDIGLLTEATLTGEEVALTIAAKNAIDSFFADVQVGTYVDDAWQISSEWKYLAGSWDVGAGTLKISAIPEPSVFGLLAGLGALALAGTRRRRRK